MVAAFNNDSKGSFFDKLLNNVSAFVTERYSGDVYKALYEASQSCFYGSNTASPADASKLLIKMLIDSLPEKDIDDSLIEHISNKGLIKKSLIITEV